MHPRMIKMLSAFLTIAFLTAPALAGDMIGGKPVRIAARGDMIGGLTASLSHFASLIAGAF